MKSPVGVRLLLQRGSHILGLRPRGSGGFDLPGGTVQGAEPREVLGEILASLKGLTVISAIPAGRHRIRPERHVGEELRERGSLDHRYATRRDGRPGEGGPGLRTK